MQTTNEVEITLNSTHFSPLSLVRRVNFLLQDEGNPAPLPHSSNDKVLKAEL
jgi:hypothetical protein